MKILFRLFFLFCILNSGSVLAQQDSSAANKEIDFMFYLIQNGQWQDFNYFSDSLTRAKAISSGAKDSVNYLAGMIHFDQANYSSSLQYLQKVSEESIFYYKAQYYASICYNELNKPDSACAVVSQFENTGNVNLDQLRVYEMAAFSLLQKKYTAFDSLSAGFSSTDSVLGREQSLLLKNADQLQHLKRKSPFVAGTLSAIIPGLGLSYSGNNGQALAAFIRVMALGALAYEDYRKQGTKNPQFYIFGSLFSFFYLGNIWSSALSVKIRHDEKDRELIHNISVGLRVPIDYFFK